MNSIIIKPYDKSYIFPLDNTARLYDIMEVRSINYFFLKINVHVLIAANKEQSYRDKVCALHPQVA